MGKWAELPEDILVLIAKQITLFEDFLFFSGVCRSWRSVAVNDNFKGSEQIPWLMLCDKDKPDEHQFVSVRKGGVIRTVHLPEARGKRCLETLGWLVTTSEDGDINLLHPFTRVQINLPHISTFEYYSARRNKYLSFINKAVLSSRPEDGKDYVLMVIYASGHAGRGHLAFWRSRDKSWILVNIVWFYDINFYNGLCYGVTGSGTVHAFDVLGPNPTVPLVVGYGPGNEYSAVLKQPYIVELAGVVLIVHRVFRIVSPSILLEEDPCVFDNKDESRVDYETCGFTVFEVGSSEKGKGVEKTSLGDNALFLGDNVPISVDASRFQGIKANCIYYTDSFKRGGNFMGIYNMEDGSLSPCYEGETSSILSAYHQQKKMGNWAELPEVLLVLTAKRITLLEDILSFSGVCRSWRSVSINNKFKGSEQIPWLMLFDKDKPDELQFISLRKGGVIRIVNLPEARGKRCLETLGWLVTISKDGHINLLHSFTRVQINLPHVTTLKDYHNYKMRNHMSIIRKAVLSSRPEEGKDYVLVVLNGCSRCLAFWRPEDKYWSAIHPSSCSFVDINFYEEPCYGVINRRGSVLAFDVWGPNWTWEWHVEINSNKKGKFMENMSLGNNALFLGDNAAVSVDASRFPGIKANCIYYTENLRREGGKDIGIYNEEDGSLKPCYEGAESLNFICQPLWVHPSSF
ncbi:hypothetical protein RHSIM_Rhsim02G0225500 [Rhododendron simsii]|uniref:F-box domain-containing protein n=1 Tax=Rhododendron simsii TaxID=118357 RepID=A0A834HC51_RHOSS|nr:hypothetical protein RHSIM_Rhsim02G0225500 [Rhododendron simsii]